MMEKNFKVFFFALIVGFLILFALISIFSSFELLSISKTKKIENIMSVPTNDYQIFQRNIETGRTSFGIVTLPTEISQGDFIFSESSESNIQSLISNFDESVFLCTGTCFCDDKQDRRTSNLASTSIWKFSTLLVSVSSILAYGVAKNQFSEKCEKSFTSDEEGYLSSTCNSIKSEVEECQNMVIEGELSYEDYDDEEGDILSDLEKLQKEDEGKPDELRKMTEEELIEMEEPYRKFYCFGRCRVNFGKLKRIVTKNEGKAFGCEKMEYGETISQVIGLDGLGATHVTMKVFFKRQLKSFCEENSMPDLENQSYENHKLIDRHVSFCTMDKTQILCGKTRKKNVKKQV